MTFLGGHARDQRSLWFFQEQTKLILCYFSFTVPVMASPQIGRVESKEYYSWMLTRTFSSLLLVPRLLYTEREPENAKDPHADAIVEDSGRIVGHNPLALSRIVLSF